MKNLLIALALLTVACETSNTEFVSEVSDGSMLEDMETDGGEDAFTGDLFGDTGSPDAWVEADAEIDTLVEPDPCVDFDRYIDVERLPGSWTPEGAEGATAMVEALGCSRDYNMTVGILTLSLKEVVPEGTEIRITNNGWRLMNNVPVWTAQETVITFSDTLQEGTGRWLGLVGVIPVWDFVSWEGDWTQEGTTSSILALRNEFEGIYADLDDFESWFHDGRDGGYFEIDSWENLRD